MIERWAPVPGYPGYEVSDLGAVRSYRISGPGDRLRREPRVMHPSAAHAGHLRVPLHRAGVKELRFVHHLVLEAFVGPRPQGKECCHNNGNPSDNRLENLRWDTSKANAADRERHGTVACGERSGARLHPERLARGRALWSAKLSDGAAMLMRYLHAIHGVSKADLSRWFDVTDTTAGLVVSGRAWTHVPMISTQEENG